MSIDDRKINLLKAMASGFPACGRTTGHGESCTSGWLCDACEKRKEISDGVMEICADIVQLNAELECARGDLKTAEGMINYHRKYSDRYRWLRAQGWSDPAEMWVVIAKTGAPIVHVDLDAAIDAAIAKERT